MASAFDIFKIGVGPSSSHTVGPMNAGKNFISLLVSSGELLKATHTVVDLYGLSPLTGKDHATDIAIMMEPVGNSPQNVNIDSIAGFTQEAAHTGRLPVAGGMYIVDFSLDKNILFRTETLPHHKNGMRIAVWSDTKTLLSRTYYSVGGGSIVGKKQFGQAHDVEAYVPYNFHSANELLKLYERNGLSVPGLMMRNGPAMCSKGRIDAGLIAIWDVMHAGTERGMSTKGVLSGLLNVPHRAVALRRLLVSSDNLSSDPVNVIDWINMLALAVGEESAVECRVVMVPTNGTCGIIPAVLAYYDKFRRPVDANSIARYLLTAGVIGALHEMNASISGVGAGCQGGTGIACSMAAAGLTKLPGGNPSQVYIAAEIAMGHNLGLICDSVAGQVQIPCIERNVVNVVKAVNAARMALRRTLEPHASLDKVIETMYETDKDMNDKYREISRGGLVTKAVCA